MPHAAIFWCNSQGSRNGRSSCVSMPHAAICWCNASSGSSPTRWNSFNAARGNFLVQYRSGQISSDSSGSFNAARGNLLVQWIHQHAAHHHERGFNAARGNLLVQYNNMIWTIFSIISFNAARGNFLVQLVDCDGYLSEGVLFQCRTRQFAGAI